MKKKTNIKIDKTGPNPEHKTKKHWTKILSKQPESNTPMNIGIDASRALRPIKTGTEWYNVEIIRHLVDLDKKNNYVLYSQKQPEAPLLNLPQNVSWRVMPFPRGWTLLRLSLEMLTNPPDVLFIPAHTLPLISPKKSVVMVHDLGFIHNPELYPARQKIYHNFVINYVKKHATHILTPTEFTRQDLIKTLGISPEKITTVWHGFDDNLYHPRPVSNHASTQYGEYIFYIGRLETKKNIVNLVKAFDLFRSSCHSESTLSCHSEPTLSCHSEPAGEESRSSDRTPQLPATNYKLLLAGKPSHGYEQIKEAINNSPYKKDIIELGYLVEEDVPVYMSNAALFAFPTSFEGFGIPIIQAMACGCPVVASDNTCIPEITGNAAILIDPQNPSQIAKAMQEILTNKEKREKLIQKGLHQAKKFSWQTSAKETLKVIENVGQKQTLIKEK